MSMYYISTRQELMQQLRQRQAVRKKILSDRNGFVERLYGIKDFSALVDEYWGPGVDFDCRASGVLCRQLSSIATEDVACYVGCLSLGLRPWIARMTHDAFRTSSADKVNRIKIPWVSWTCTGRRVLSYEHLTVEKAIDLEGVPLSQIKLRDGRMLPDWHAEKREQLFGNCLRTADFSDFFSACLRAATQRPTFVYKPNGDGREERVSTFDVGDPTIRAPAEWYYPLYLSLFVDGSTVLLETYENPAGGVPIIRGLFQRSMDTIRQAVGWQPAVVEIPPLTASLLCCNRHLLAVRLPFEIWAASVGHVERLVDRFSLLAGHVYHFGLPLSVPVLAFA